jgi:hypothetical protein
MYTQSDIGLFLEGARGFSPLPGGSGSYRRLVNAPARPPPGPCKWGRAAGKRSPFSPQSSKTKDHRSPNHKGPGLSVSPCSLTSSLSILLGTLLGIYLGDCSCRLGAFGNRPCVRRGLNGINDPRVDAVCAHSGCTAGLAKDLLCYGGQGC